VQLFFEAYFAFLRALANITVLGAKKPLFLGICRISLYQSRRAVRHDHNQGGIEVRPKPDGLYRLDAGEVKRV
jgi:hypothetical protein